MKPFIHKLLLMQLAVVASVSLSATVYSGSCGPELNYSLDSGTGVLTITGRGAMTNASGWEGYDKRDVLKKVVCDANMTSVCANAFHGCYRLQTVTLNDSVESVGAYAFQECTALTYCDLGKGVKTIGDMAFMHCTELRKIRWSDCLETIGSMVFYECENVGDTVFFPKTLKKIGSNLFSYNGSGKVAVWNVKRMGDFTQSSGLGQYQFNRIIFGDSVEYIPAYLAIYVGNDSIHLPETVTGIGRGAFMSCSYLKKINIPASVTSIGSSAFSGCKSLEQLVLPSGLKEIPESLCNQCLALDSVKLPEGITVIPTQAFSGCKSLKRIRIPNGVTNIGNMAFSNCSLDTLVLPSSLTILGDKVFINPVNYVSPKELVLNEKLIATGMETFANWRTLQKVTIGKNVAILGQSCFAGDSAINDITCYAAQPPMVYDQTFAGVPDTAVLRVLPASVSAYKSAQYWSRFRIVAMDADEYIQNKVTVDAGETTANFTWPTDENAASYEIDIYKDGTVFCKLTLGPKGQLLGIDFSGPDVDISIPAPKRSQDSDVPATLSFMVTGLDKASRYNYVLSTLDADDKPLHVYIGDFATIGYEGELNPDSGNEVLPTPPIIPYDPESTPIPTGDAVNNASAIHGGSETSSLRIVRNGRLLFVTPSGTYDITGKRIE